ncbi:hypothetical protein LCGC14_1608830 [marine sediment metagenome]|uniref:Uncharacterized protein n=1 Tax=marine sediment metagenome TaxID=412755 RepID=A0A0F9IVL2_9ZZZZ
MKGRGWLLILGMVVVVSAFTLGFSLGDAFGNLDECRAWTTGQAGDVSTPCPADIYSNTLVTLSVLILGAGVGALAFWALFRRG